LFSEVGVEKEPALMVEMEYVWFEEYGVKFLVGGRGR